MFASVACWERLAFKIGGAEDGEWCRYSRAARVGVVVVGAMSRFGSWSDGSGELTITHLRSYGGGE